MEARGITDETATEGGDYMGTFFKKRRILVILCMLLVLGCASSTHVYAGQNAIDSAQNKKTISLKKGKKKTLSVTIGGYRLKGSAVKFKSSNTKVATVSKSGKVTAKKVGKAKITYYPKQYPWAKFTCKIVVKKK